MTVAIFVALLLLPSIVGMKLSPTWIQARRWEREWKERLAGSEEELRELILGCGLLDMELPMGRMRDDPDVSRFLSNVRNREYVIIARQFTDRYAMESLLVGAEYRMGGAGRPVSMDYGYLQEVVQELARRFGHVEARPYR